MNLSRLFSGCICFVIGCALVSGLTGLVATASAADSKEEDSIYMRCLRKLPTTLKSSSDAPETMRFLVPIKDYAVDYEKEISGEGWGASLKYRNVACEVVVYAYDHARNGLTDADARKERDEFDGFLAESIFEKEVGTHTFYGTAGLSALTANGDKQVQMFSVGAVNQTFIKYRTVCRYLTDIPLDANYRIADMMTTEVMKQTLVPLDTCLSQEKQKAGSNKSKITAHFE